MQLLHLLELLLALVEYWAVLEVDWDANGHLRELQREITVGIPVHTILEVHMIWHAHAIRPIDLWEPA